MASNFQDMFTHDSLDFTSHVDDYRFDLGEVGMSKSNLELFDMWVHSPAFTALTLDVLTLVLPQSQRDGCKNAVPHFRGVCALMSYHSTTHMLSVEKCHCA